MLKKFIVSANPEGVLYVITTSVPLLPLAVHLPTEHHCTEVIDDISPSAILGFEKPISKRLVFPLELI